ncbi:MAG: amino acid adenylation domain-containing protein, partial [Thermoanaerobaculia bacterium]
EACLHDLFEAQVRRTPTAVALSFEGEELRYDELDERAGRLAHHLRSLGVRPGVLVGLCVERSLELVIGLLGILKAGGAYVPLDPGYPEERLAFQMADARVAVLLTQERLLSRLPGDLGPVLLLDRDLGTAPDVALPEVTPDNLAYVIYTSGSTGRPKGVMNRHRGIANRLLWVQERYPLSPADRVIQKTPFSFDVSVWEFFWPLIAGARLVMARPGGHQDPAYLVDTIRREGITVSHFVPSMLQAFLEAPGVEECRSLERVMASGEALPPELEQRFFARLGGVGTRLFNLYGPTEAAVEVTHWECSPVEGRLVVPIGHPVANTAIHLVDRDFEPVPVGVPGELLIAGVQVARGYLGRPDLTAERFVPDPFSAEPGARVYRSGDLARRRTDGAVEFLGRIDHQVKIRGFRIELGEIEAALASHPAVREAVVLARQDKTGGQTLIAYVAGDGPETAGLRELLRRRLPEYMVPAFFVALPALPLNPNGKVDRGALARIEPFPETGAAGEGAAPRTVTEELLAGLWAELLGRESVGVHDNFFELGGHSLLATRLVSRIRSALRRELPVAALFERPTVAELAAALESVPQGDPLPPIERARGDRLELSFAQQRLWFLDRLEPASSLYNLPAAFRLRGPLDVAAWSAALNEVVRRHEALRTTFEALDGEPVQ